MSDVGMTDTNAMRELAERLRKEGEQVDYAASDGFNWCQVRDLTLFEASDAILALLATDRAAGVGEVERAEAAFNLIAPFVEKFAAAAKHYDGGRPRYEGSTFLHDADPSYQPALCPTTTGIGGPGSPASPTLSDLRLLADGYAQAKDMLAASPPAPADASDFSPHRWTEIISNGLGANNAGCWRCGALSEVLARVLSLSGHDAKVIQGKANGEDHVWVQIGDTVYDPTVGQFQEPVSYQMDQVAPADASGEVAKALAHYDTDPSELSRAVDAIEMIRAAFSSTAGAK